MDNSGRLANAQHKNAQHKEVPIMIDGLVREALNLRQLATVRHGFFTRQGGSSNGIYGSLNVGLGSSDDRAMVMENRRRVANQLGAYDGNGPLHDIVTNYQVHGAKCLRITSAEMIAERQEADALVTNVPGLAIGALTADCTPVLFADSANKIVGAAHAGWRGARAGVLEATVARMQELGSRPRDIHVAIGPTISQANYEVGPEFEAQLVNDDPSNVRYFCTPDGKSRAHFDLVAYCHDRLARAGITNIEVLGDCTYGEDELYFSYRRATHQGESDYGRQISAILVA